VRLLLSLSPAPCEEKLTLLFPVATEAATNKNLKPLVEMLERAWFLDHERNDINFKHRKRQESTLQATMDLITQHLVQTLPTTPTRENPANVWVFYGDGKNFHQGSGADRTSVVPQAFLQKLNAHPFFKVLIMRQKERWTSQTCPDPECMRKAVDSEKEIGFV
jgi:hypothetical protein